jgi:hypothetical protein
MIPNASGQKDCMDAKQVDQERERVLKWSKRWFGGDPKWFRGIQVRIVLNRALIKVGFGIHENCFQAQAWIHG